MNALVLSAIFGVVMMFSGVVFKRNASIKATGIIAMIVLLLVNCMEMGNIKFFKFDVSAFMVFNDYALFFNSIAIFATLVYLVLTSAEMEKVGRNLAEYFALIFFIIAGITLTTSFTSLLTLFLGIEIISIPLYILTGSDKRNLKSNEAALKYFLMGSFSTGIMLMGIALIYGSQGSFSIDAMNFSAAAKTPNLHIAGMLFLLFAMSFKASVAPFHFWTPDVYDGAPTVFTSFMATIVKAAVFIGFVRLFGGAFGKLESTWSLWVAVMIAATLFVGNITAVFQQSVKRMLSYSSIAQAGFLLFGVYVMNEAGREGLLIYSAAYCLATIGIFAVLSKMTDYSFEGFNGLAKHQPLLAFTTTICLLSLAGIPLTAGFLGKFYMLKAAVSNGGNLWLVIFAVVMAAVSVYYYFRVIQAMYFKDGPVQSVAATPLEKYTLLIVCVLIILIGVFPNVFLNWLYFSR
ncbi:NADH-quinone oxidoreductase subunit N [Niabella insulamsoli]|uniref:NADH-quinone oxidoreductase subunit N n=1 Tax=Niabella insulamsoli TaxID=3144874 RepID=UPI0031FC23CD